ncbi:MAG: FHA domain-containing protein [Rhizonema sp. PD37]|nr:FHA domain-containing protein [Rhizonema sp. PD37]
MHYVDKYYTKVCYLYGYFQKTNSRQHAAIDSDAQGRYILRDYSTNGVFVDRQRVNGTTLLSPGATIRIGTYTLLLFMMRLGEIGV